MRPSGDPFCERTHSPSRARRSCRKGIRANNTVTHEQEQETYHWCLSGAVRVLQGLGEQIK